MAHFSMFGSNDGQLVPGRDFYITIFGGSDLKRLPAASQIAELRQRPAFERDQSQYIFCTLFGGTTLTWPTLAEEYLALRDALRAGTITLDDWDRSVARPGGPGPLRTLSLTLFGSFDGDVLPREEKELDDLSLQRHLGQIPEAAVQLLMLAIGQAGGQRLAAVRHAVLAAISQGATAS
jgi:hypothetical protein